MAELFMIGVGAISAAAFALGGWLWLRPRSAVEWQMRCYLRINWRMEPVSWDKEIRNTRWMGGSLIVFTAGVCLYRWLA